MMQQDGIAAPPPTHAAVMSRLTARQQEILTCFLAEPNEARIGKRLGLAPQTVRNQIAGILKRLNVSCRAELVKVALLAGFAANRQDGRAVDVGDAEAVGCAAGTQNVLGTPTSGIDRSVKL